MKLFNKWALYLVCGVSFFILSLFYHSKVFAFSEEFKKSYTDSSAWVAIENDGLIRFTPDSLVLDGKGQKINSFPYLYLINTSAFGNGLPTTLEIRFRFDSLGGYGSGINITDGIVLSKQEREEKAIFQVWQDSAKVKLTIFSYICSENEPSCTERFPIYISDIDDTKYHILKIVYNTFHKYEVYFDDFDQPIFVSESTLRGPGGLDFGNVASISNVDYWSNLEIDYVYINEEIPDNTHPIILVPGLGASWDYGAILNGVEGENWRIPGWIDVYDDLVATLDSTGYQSGDNLFIFTYDWRKGLASLSSELDQYISNLVDENKIGAGNKAYLIGHSYGGLLGRAYLQQTDDDYVERLITLGSPHQGSAQAYGAWEGAQMWSRPWWQKVALEVLLKLNRQPGESKVEAIRRMSPSIQDLLPTNNYLYDLDQEKWKENTDLQQKNSTLMSLEDVSIIDEKSLVMGGNGQTTIESIEVKERNWFDEALDQWEDGKPVKLRSSQQGDGTVLLSSALGEFSNTDSWESDHVNLVANTVGIEKILQSVGKEGTVIDNNIEDESEEALVILLRSPGELQVINPQGQALDKDKGEFDGYFVDGQKMIIIPYPTLGDYQVRVEENGETGSYSLYVGWLKNTETKWLDFSGVLEQSETDSFKIRLDESNLLINGEEAYNYWEAINQLLNKLELLLVNWTDRKGWRAGVFFDTIKDQILTVRAGAQAEAADILLRRARFLLYQLAAQAEAAERWQIAETSEDLLFNLENLSYQYTQTEEEEVNRYRDLLDKMIAYQESVLEGSENKMKVQSLIKAKTLKRLGDKRADSKQWTQAKEAYLSSWFCLLKI